MNQFFHIDEPNPAAPPKGFALWALGFRPFYLLASIFAAVSIGFWGLQFSGLLGRPYLQGPLWHAHEMLFGFALAVIVGFLFTAGRNWSNRATPTGGLLAAFTLLWLAGRVLVLTPFGWAAALVNVAFPLCAAVALAVPFIAAGNKRNYFFIALLALMSLAELAVHLDHLGVLALPAWVGIQVGLDVVLFIITVMAGRVVPMFTNNGVPSAKAAKDPRVEKLALGSVLALLAADVLQAPPAAIAALAMLAAAAHIARWVLWKPWKTFRVPLVWVLHIAYAWIPIHLLLRALASFGGVAPTTAVHALTAGAIGGMIIGMMTRTARGHTGRPLEANAWDVACYGLVLTAALVRVAGPVVLPQWTMGSIVLSAALWSAGFGLYALCYWTVLTRPRLDGKPG